MSIARDTSRSLSETVADLVRRGLGHCSSGEVSRSQVTGLPIVRLGHEFWPDDAFDTVALNGVIGHRQVTDAYLAHLARVRGGRLATFNPRTGEAPC
jgi:hypothetical protein